MTRGGACRREEFNIVAAKLVHMYVFVDVYVYVYVCIYVAAKFVQLQCDAVRCSTAQCGVERRGAVRCCGAL